ncbi:hypothetical protein Tco_1094029 [Tanacetum coccineum]|uniref:Zinc finger, CCHC-type n=1 Tax=Tanacetum coccineum TaxID=301880 RepID=A0ABQ5IED4_9ASTR
MTLATTPLLGFSGKISWPLGQMSLMVSLGDAEYSTIALMKFMVVRSPSPYNGIIDRPSLRKIQEVPSTVYGLLMFPVKEGIVTLHSSTIIPAECIMVAKALNEPPRTSQTCRRRCYFLAFPRMNVVYVLTTPILEDGENATMEQIRRRDKWENDDYVCRGLILNGMSDPLFDVYQNVKSSKELWDSLKAKYMAEDASSSHLCIAGSFRVQDSDKPKGNNVVGLSVSNRRMMILRGGLTLEQLFMYVKIDVGSRLFQVIPDIEQGMLSLMRIDFLQSLDQVRGTRDEVSDQHSYCFNVEDDLKIFDDAMKS